LADPHHARPMDEPLHPVCRPRRPFRDPVPAEHELTHSRGDRPRSARDIVGQEDPVSVVAFQGHVVAHRNSYIIALLWVVRKYSWPVNMSSRRRERVMEACSVRSPLGKAWVKARRHDRFYRAAKKQAYRSRAAIQLLQIDRRYCLFHEGLAVVDLGLVPG